MKNKIIISTAVLLTGAAIGGYFFIKHFNKSVDEALDEAMLAFNEGATYFTD